MAVAIQDILTKYDSRICSTDNKKFGHRPIWGKTTESDRHADPTSNPNPDPYLVAARYSNLAPIWFHNIHSWVYNWLYEDILK